MNDPSLAAILDVHLRNRFFGKYRGRVTDVYDDGTIQALVPTVLGEEKTGLCLPCVPYAGPDCGIAFLPEVDSGVWIEFEGRDVSLPIWVGAYWHKDEQPSKLKSSVKVIRTKGKQEIVLDDLNHSITITDSNGNSVTLNKKGIVLKRANGKIEISNRLIKLNGDAMEVT